MLNNGQPGILIFPKSTSNINPKLRRFYQTQTLTSQQADSSSALPVDVKRMPGTESTCEQITQQDILTQMALKNQLLIAQVAEYKVMVSQLQTRISILERQNYQLQSNRNHDKQNQRKYINEKQQNKQSSEYKQYKQQGQIKKTTIDHQECLNIKEICNLIDLYTIDTENFELHQLRQHLRNITQQNREHLSFIQMICNMKERVEPGPEQTLLQLWTWLKKIGNNYRLLQTYHQQQKGKDRNRTSTKEKSAHISTLKCS